MDIIELKNKIIDANKKYREGESIMSDIEFDNLVEEAKLSMSDTEFNVFRDSLHERSGKVKHPFIMGSLDKLKFEEPDKLNKYIKKYIKDNEINKKLTKDDAINISAKVDGISCRIHYNKDGVLESASTRGDGYYGEDITDKIKYVKNVPKNIPATKEFDIRGELVILKKDFELMSGFSNPRNACAGIINRKEFNKSDVSNISFIAYTILGKKFVKFEQFKMLNYFGFTTTWNSNVTLKDLEIVGSTVSDGLFSLASKEHDYETDGLVICSPYYLNEEKYKPDACVAFKINQLVGKSKIIDVVFEGPSKDGNHIPVAIFEPIELGGAIVSRATLHNLDFMHSQNIMYGSDITILKSGDIIPKVIKVENNDSGCTPIELPEICNCCQSPLVRDGVNLRCMNPDCKDQKIYQITHFIKKLGVKFASNKTLENFGILSYDDLINFKANPKYKSEVKFENELYDNVFSKDKQTLFCALNVKGLSEILLNKIVDFYGYENIENFENMNITSLPVGVGDITLDKFKESYKENLNIVNKIISNIKYHYVENSEIKKISNKNGMSVCFTGKLLTMTRNDASKLAEKFGYEVKNTVSKGLTYLVNNDIESKSSKNKKALSLGIKIINETDFIKLVSDINDSEVDLSEL